MAALLLVFGLAVGVHSSTLPRPHYYNKATKQQELQNPEWSPPAAADDDSSLFDQDGGWSQSPGEGSHGVRLRTTEGGGLDD